MNSPKTLRITKAKQKLAAGILIQARRDLRRFYDGTSRVERDLFFDAYTWVSSENCSWPFSFLNVCRLLNRVPAELRQELIDDLSLGSVPYWSRRVGRIVRRFQISARDVLLPPPPQLALS